MSRISSTHRAIYLALLREEPEEAENFDPMAYTRSGRQAAAAYEPTAEEVAEALAKAAEEDASDE